VEVRRPSDTQPIDVRLPLARYRLEHLAGEPGTSQELREAIGVVLDRMTELEAALAEPDTSQETPRAKTGRPPA
jgi:hypothetical protein